jgi:alcohol dehydrogenase (cytochrome c)
MPVLTTYAARRISSLLYGLVFCVSTAAADASDSGRKEFETRCAKCHGADGRGGEFGPAVISALPKLNDLQLSVLIVKGVPTRGMPPTAAPGAEVTAIVGFLRRLQAHASQTPQIRERIQTTDGRVLDGLILGEGFEDVQMLTGDMRVHLLRRAGGVYREVTSEAAWPAYNGDPGGNRYTSLTQINRDNVSRLAPRWIFSLPDTASLQVTPVVVDGIMYVTSANECYALDAGTGRRIWHYRRPRTAGLVGDAARGINRGVTVAGDRVFMETDHAHLIALNRWTGDLLWDTEMADWRQNYFATSAPLAVGDLVVGGVGGGEHGANGFVAAFEQASGKEVWRFWAVPKRGQPGSETWAGSSLDHGGAPTWFTGTYDPQLGTVYWPTGNPSEEYNGDMRAGDNLYSNTILALDAKTGKLRWHYQFTPHDLWDWDATETPVLIDTVWQGRPRKLLLHANRNGFFYVFDRTNGELLRASPFVKHLTWASGIGTDGRPIKNPNQTPTKEGTKVCPSQWGATNWFAPSFSPNTGLYYVQTYEMCGIYTKSDSGTWEPGKSFLGGSHKMATDPKPQRILKAIELQTGAVAWELVQPGPVSSWGGTLASAAGLVIFCAEGGALMGADAVSGKPLWKFDTNQVLRSSPMTYTFDGKQYIAAAAGSNIIAFAIH